MNEAEHRLKQIAALEGLLKKIQSLRDALGYLQDDIDRIRHGVLHDG